MTDKPEPTTEQIQKWHTSFAAVVWHDLAGILLRRLAKAENEIELWSHENDLKRSILNNVEARLDAVKKLHVCVFNAGYALGHNDTVESCYTDILLADMYTYHDDIVSQLITDELQAELKGEQE